MRYFIFNFKEKEIQMRLTSQDCVQLEKNNGVRLLDYVQDYSITTITTLLKYMRKGGGEHFTDAMAYDFYDELIDEGYTLETILDEVIYEVLVVSGILSKNDLDNIRKEKAKVENMTVEEKQKLVEERKNLQK